MNHAAYLLAVAAGCLTLTGCMPNDGGPAASMATSVVTISGSIAYRERIALRPGSIATITLNDVSLADAPSPIIGEQKIDLTGQQVPIPFDLGVPADKLVQRHRYSVRATISGPHGTLMWTTDTAHIIDPASATQDIGVLNLVRVAASAAANPLQPRRNWVVEDVDRKGIIDNSRVTLNFSEDGRVSGRAGCNNFSGSYTLKGQQLTMGNQFALTRKMCAPALMRQERRFMDALHGALRVSRSRDGALTLTGDAGQVILAR